MKHAPSEARWLNIKPANQVSVGPQVDSVKPTKLCAGEALCGSRKKKV